jgi:hypothetical protein
MNRIRVSNEELRGSKELARELPKVVTALEDGELEKCVVMRHGKMVAVILSIPAYEELLAGVPS